mmetsp:Transcript_39815/g.83708  ORF Transcript_39815/g.83708 Transcript_39815/m.83708 type:complete len:91 (+) Transcript_39815:3379-3651(+)
MWLQNQALQTQDQETQRLRPIAWSGLHFRNNGGDKKHPLLNHSYLRFVISVRLLFFRRVILSPNVSLVTGLKVGVFALREVETISLMFLN